MVGPDGKPEKRSAGKERRRTSRLFSEGLQLRNRTGSMRQQTKEYPARGKDSGGVGGLQGKSRMRILASAIGACLTRQAGFAAARPAARGGLWEASRGRSRSGSRKRADSGILPTAASTGVITRVMVSLIRTR